MEEKEILQWFTAREKEPPDEGNIAIENGGYYKFVNYLPPRRGEKLGEWEFSDGETRHVKPGDRWVWIDPLFNADTINGKVIFISQELKN